MSRHEVTAYNPAHKVIVGWDHPRQTFFAQVIDRAKEKSDPDNKLILWKGTSLRELYEISDVRRAIALYAPLSVAQECTLYGDKDEGR